MGGSQSISGDVFCNPGRVGPVTLGPDPLSQASPAAQHGVDWNGLIPIGLFYYRF